MKPPNPFKGLSPYTTTDENKFWGRTRETESLVDYASTERLLVVYGKSGVGKTSLLQAGMIPRLQANGAFSVYARIDKDPIDAIQARVIETFPVSARNSLRKTENLASFFDNADETLARTTMRERQETPMILVLDQFEDFFGTFAGNGAEENRRKFTNQIAEVIYRKNLPVSLLFSLREDFLPEMNYFRGKIPFILSNHYRLAPLTLEAAETVINKTLAGIGYQFEKELTETVLADLEKSGEGGIEPYALQIMCSEIWDRWQEEATLITLDFYTRQLQGMQNILGSFVTKKVEEFPLRHERAIKNIFAELFTDRGRGRLVHVSSLYESVKDDVASEQELTEKILEPLDKEYRLLTIRSIKNVPYCEPVHDALSQKANEWRRERDRDHLEKELRKEHSRKRKRVILVAAILALSVSLAVAMERILAANAPWGFFVDLKTSRIYPLKGDKVNIGRNVPEAAVRNDISFSNRLVSRNHLVVLRDRTLEDLRSRNGTSINARLLPYGIASKLANGDVIALANVEALQFKVKKPASSPPVPTGAWAVFVNGPSKNYQYLVDSGYSVFMNDGKLSIQPGLSESALLELQWSHNKAWMLDASNEWNVVFTIKESDYDYKSYILPSRQWIEIPDVPLQYVKTTPDKKKELEEGPDLQVILMTEPQR